MRSRRLFAALYWTQRVWEWTGIGRHRRGVTRGVRGRTLEIGVGTGFSLPLYPVAPAVAVDADPAMLRRAVRRARRLGLPTAFVVADGAALPFAEESFDTVVSCLTLCSVERPDAVLGEVGRVLRPGGQFRFVEHGRSDRPGFARLQRIVDPLWGRALGGCRMTRDPAALIARSGLVASRLEACSAGTIVRGTAHPTTAAATAAAEGRRRRLVGSRA